MPASSSTATATFPGMKNATGYSCLIQVALPIDEGRRCSIGLLHVDDKVGSVRGEILWL